jgi:hypothetical protein
MKKASSGGTLLANILAQENDYLETIITTKTKTLRRYEFLHP